VSDEKEIGAPWTVAIVGGGQAGAEVATLLRHYGHQGRIILLGDEKFLPYMRPTLSKA
jgi:3-phenylpropionate/trans-cinnamate dioxygenase ferredoxin reductase component